MKTYLKKYKLIILIALILIIPFISNKYHMGHDTAYHLINIDVLIKMIKEFNLTKVFSILANNFGYGCGIFYPQLPHILAAAIGLFSSNIVAIKVVYFMIILLSGIFMYHLQIKIVHNEKIASVGSIFYMTMPYFIQDIYVRDALNEAFIFVFMPLIFLGLINLMNQEKDYLFYPFFIIGYIGIVNSHLVLAVYFTMLVLIFMLVNYKKFFIKENLKKLVLASIVILIFILPSVVMIMEHNRLNFYTVFDHDSMNSSLLALKYNGLGIKDYFNLRIKTTGSFYFINIVVILLSILGFIRLVKKEKSNQNKMIIFGLIVFTLLSVLLSWYRFPYKIFPSIMWSIQFPSRCVSFVNFGLSIIAGYGLLIIPKNKQKIVSLISILMCVTTSIFYINYTDFKESSKLEYDINLGMGWQKEYLPKTTNANIDYLNYRDNDIHVLSNDTNIKIKMIDNDTPNLKFKVSGLKEKSIKIQLPRIYYLGYDVTINNKKIKYSYDKYGFMTITVSQNGIVNIEYNGTLIYKITVIVRNIFIIILFGYFIYKRRKKNSD